jgi:hypothetical protein
MVGWLDQLQHKSYVDVSTHERFGVEPTSFAQFARQHAAEFLPRRAANVS